MATFFPAAYFQRSIALGAALVLPILSGCAQHRSHSAPRTQTPPAASGPVKKSTSDWRSLFDGQTMKGWAVADYAGHGEVTVEEGKLILGNGVMTGATYTNPVPHMNYEIALKAMRVDGSDFFCGLTFPVGEDPCSLIVGGWGGGLIGLSNLDGQDASQNETTQHMFFENKRWYSIRLRVTPKRIEAWIDETPVIAADITGKRISIRPEVELSRPLGVATWSTTGAIKDVQVRPVTEAAGIKVSL